MSRATWEARCGRRSHLQRQNRKKADIRIQAYFPISRLASANSVDPENARQGRARPDDVAGTSTLTSFAKSWLISGLGPVDGRLKDLVVGMGGVPHQPQRAVDEPHPAAVGVPPDERAPLDGEKNDRMAFQARADYQNHAIG